MWSDSGPKAAATALSSPRAPHNRALRIIADVNRPCRHHHSDRARRPDHLRTFSAPMIDVPIAGSAPREIQAPVPSTSSSMLWGCLGSRQSPALKAPRSPSVGFTAPPEQSLGRKAMGAISETTAPGASEASIARAFSSSDHRRRPPPNAREIPTNRNNRRLRRRRTPSVDWPRRTRGITPRRQFPPARRDAPSACH